MNKKRVMQLVLVLMIVFVLVQITKAETVFDTIKNQIAVRLYPSDYWDPEQLVYRVDFESILSTIVLDFPEAVKAVSPGEALSWGRTLDELMIVGIDNVVANYSPEIFTHQISESQELYVITGGGVFTTTFLYKLDLFEEIIGKYGALVSIPHREAILVLPIHSRETLEDVDVFINVTIGMYMDGPGSMSHYIWLYRDNVFQRVDIVTPDYEVFVLLPNEMFESSLLE